MKTKNRHFDLKSSTSLYHLPVSGYHLEPHLSKLEELIEYSAQLLPAEGPVGAFVFQNPLHAMEYMQFEQAVQYGSRLFGCQPYWSEAQYRQAFEQQRIRLFDLRSVLKEDCGPTAWEMVGGLVSRMDLRLALLRTPVFSGPVGELRWFMEEKESLTRFDPEIPLTTRKLIVGDVKRWVVRDLINPGSRDGGYQPPRETDPRRQHVLWPILPVLAPVMSGEKLAASEDGGESTWEQFALKALWQVCCQAAARVGPPPTPEVVPSVRPRDALLKATGVDIDTLVHEVLIPFTAAFTDQGLAHWPLPTRDQGFLKAFSALYRLPGGSLERWRQGLAQELARLEAKGISALESIRESLTDLGIPESEWKDFFPATLLPLRGWTSMIRQMEVRPDRVPAPCTRGTLTEFLAVRLILERLALAHVAREELGYCGPLKGLRERLRRPLPTNPVETREQRAFTIFRLAQSLGWKPSELQALTRHQWAALFGEIEEFSEIERRRIFHLAFEERYRHKALNAISAHVAQSRQRVKNPRFQIACCIDAREESFRRHLEEIAPDVETFGAAGFYSVPMYFRGAADAHFSALCPIVVHPKHWVEEEVPYSLAESHRFRAKARQVLGATTHHFAQGSRSFALGALLTSTLGVLATIPLVCRLLFPRWTSAFVDSAGSLVAPPPVTRLTLERTAETPGCKGHHLGFSVEEMASIGERVLRDIGLTSGFSRLMIFLGHGSDSVNNPHKAAYDCGACSGNGGGPNARALAEILNDRRIRAMLEQRGLSIPDTTVFLGGFHNTCIDAITYFDLDRLPKSHIPDFEAARDTLEQVNDRNAHERCRRFYSAPLNLSLQEAREHVRARSVDLAQTRPEFGNASNALCIVGRRERIRGLFLDRRSFLHSYDPLQDDENGTILARILSAVVPVCQGINLQYYFSAVDPSGWGAGTKLPYNVTSMLGVMDGAQSDLRQGLPAQGVEIHEPVRCLFVIETTPEIMRIIMGEDKVVGRVLRNGWAQLALLDPSSNELRLYHNDEFEVFQPEGENPTLAKCSSSLDWYLGRREHLDFAAIEPTAINQQVATVQPETNGHLA